MSGSPPDLFGPIDRRTFLRGTAGGAAALAAAALLPAGCGGYPAVANLHTFTAKEFAVLRALVDTYLPPAERMASGRDLDVAGYLDAYLAAESAMIRKQLKQALLLLEYGGLWYGPERRRCTRMSEAGRAAYLRGWSEAVSPFRRQVAQTFRRAAINVYYTDERAWGSIGYDGPFVASAGATPPGVAG